jgi:isopenicillin-N epimerase
MNYKELFLLDPEVTFLNFGSFGACPKEIFLEYQAIQLELEREPVQFITRTGLDKLHSSREALASYINCHPDDLVFMVNPTYAINTIARSLNLKPGDEILSTDLEYGAMDRTWEYYCEQSGAKYVRNPITLPIRSKEDFLNEFWSACSDHTKVIFVSHITSATGIILPVEEICDEARKRGLLIILDGAHVPGHIPLDIQKLDPDVYTGACHKWMMAPKGVSFLYVKREQQSWVDPLLISWGYQSEFPSHSQFLDYHQTAGTRDFSAFLTIPACLRFMEKYNWAEVANINRQRTNKLAEEFMCFFNFTPISPLNQDWLGQLFSIPIQTSDPQSLQRLLFDEYRLELPVARNGKHTFLRFSVQAFNTGSDYERLKEVMIQLLQKGIIQL